MTKKTTRPAAYPRLTTVLDAIPETEVVADIGYDHGYLIRHLVRRPEAPRVIGVEIQPDLARRFRDRHDDLPPDVRARIDLRTGDGLRPLRPGETRVAVMAGIGERAMLTMLADASAVAGRLETLVLCPSHPPVHLVHELGAAGWWLEREWLVAERRHLYWVGRAVRGTALPAGEPFRFFGATLREPPHPLLVSFAAYIQRRNLFMFRHRDRQPPLRAAFCDHVLAILRTVDPGV